MSSQIEYSDRYYDDEYEYRHVTLPSKVASRVPTNQLLQEREWRAHGIQQSAGWMHYALNKREPHILLFKRPKNFEKLPVEEKNEWHKKAEELVNQENEVLKNPPPSPANYIDFDRLYY